MALNLILIVWLSVFSIQDNGVPSFKGGERSLSSFISRSLIYPEYSKQNCLQGTVNISFQLTRNGIIFNSKVEKGFGIDLDDEALRIVRLTSGKWIVPVSFDTVQSIVIPINFSLKDFDCNRRSAEDAKQAIAAYKARLDLSNAIINFYEKKSTQAYSAADENRIQALKQQLGYDDKFFSSLFKQAQQKLRQGDKEGACEDFNLIRRLGSDMAQKAIVDNCSN